jgi:hypothetical protein
MVQRVDPERNVVLCRQQKDTVTVARLRARLRAIRELGKRTAAKSNTRMHSGLYSRLNFSADVEILLKLWILLSHD